MTRGLPAELDLHDPAIYRLYFERFYRRTDHDARQIQQLRQALDYPEVALKFRMIDDDTSLSSSVQYEEKEAFDQPMRRLPSSDIPSSGTPLSARVAALHVNLRQSEIKHALQRGLAEEMAELPVSIWRASYDRCAALIPVAIWMLVGWSSRPSQIVPIGS